MKLILPFAAILALLAFTGCTQKQVYEGTLFTYAADREPEDEVIYIGPVSLTEPRRIFNSDGFWLTFAELNPNLSASQIRSVRSNLKIRRVEKIRFQESWVSQWLLLLGDGDQLIFNSLCSTYEKEHQRLQMGNTSEAEVFLLERRNHLQEDYIAAQKAHAKSTSPDSEKRLEIAQNHFNQIDERVKALGPADKPHGQIVHELMASGEDTIIIKN